MTTFQNSFRPACGFVPDISKVKAVTKRQLATGTVLIRKFREMTTVLGTINDREILYADLHDNLREFEEMDLDGRVVYVIADEIEHPLLETFAEWAIDKNVRYMAATGKACSQVDDLFDMVMVGRSIEGRNMPDWFRSTDDLLLTTWHHDRAEGFWFLATTARYEEIPIHTVLVANFTEANLLEEFKNFTHKIRAGWLPGE